MAAVGDAEGLGSSILIQWTTNLDLPLAAPTATMPKPRIGPPTLSRGMFNCFPFGSVQGRVKER